LIGALVFLFCVLVFSFFITLLLTVKEPGIGGVVAANTFVDSFLFSRWVSPLIFIFRKIPRLVSFFLPPVGREAKVSISLVSKIG